MTHSTVPLTPRQSDRLATEQVIWLTTVKTSGEPVPTPVCFLWHEGEFLIFSEPGTPKLANIARSAVALNFNSTEHGGDVAVFHGEARVDPGGPTVSEWDEYVDKYSGGLISLDTTAEKFRHQYSTLIRLTPKRVRGW
jgi:PPOX class probable F420-dependent enzyme